MDEELAAVRLQLLNGFCKNVSMDRCIKWAKVVHSPSLTSMSVIVCHLFIATNHLPSPRRRQLRSITSFCLSPPRTLRIESSRGWLNCPPGNKNDVTITCSSAVSIQYTEARGRFMTQSPRTFSAPAAIHSAAFFSLMPPPTCRPLGQAPMACFAASSLPGPSMMTWAPSRSLSLYSWA